MADRPAQPGNAPDLEWEVTPEMVEAGEDAILRVLGGADLGGFFDARELAASVYRAMARASSKRDLAK